MSDGTIVDWGDNDEGQTHDQAGLSGATWGRRGVRSLA